MERLQTPMVIVNQYYSCYIQRKNNLGGIVLSRRGCINGKWCLVKDINVVSKKGRKYRERKGVSGTDKFTFDRQKGKEYVGSIGS